MVGRGSSLLSLTLPLLGKPVRVQQISYSSSIVSHDVFGQVIRGVTGCSAEEGENLLKGQNKIKTTINLFYKRKQIVILICYAEFYDCLLFMDHTKDGELCGEVVILQYEQEEQLAASFVSFFFTTDLVVLNALKKCFTTIILKR